MEENKNKLEKIMIENNLTYEKVGKNWAKIAGAKHLILKTLKELSEIAENESLNVIIIAEMVSIKAENNKKIRHKLNTLNSNFREFGISFFVEPKEFCKEKKLMIEIAENRLNTINAYPNLIIKTFKSLSNYECEKIFDDFLVFNFADSGARDFWRNKLK